MKELVAPDRRRDAARPARVAGIALVVMAAVAAADRPEVSAADLSPSGPSLGSAQQAQAEGPRRFAFDIRAQDLDTALTALADRANLKLLFTSGQVAGKRTEGLTGSFTPEEALQRLLAGTGLRYRFLSADSVTLESESTAQTEGTETRVEPVVVSATRTETPVSELTRSVTVVGREAIERQSRIDRSLGAILSKSVPGFSQSTEALTDFGQTLRGRNFLTLIDGVPQSSPLRDGRRSLNTISADAIERVEVVRGGSATYGFGATGGVVNIITRRPEEGTVNGHSEAGIKVSATNPDDSLEWHTNHQVSGRAGEFDYLVGGTFVQRNGFFDADGDRIPADPFGVQGGLADTDAYNLLGKVGYELDEGRQRIELSANRFSIFQDSAFAGLGEGDPANGEKTPAVRGNDNVRDPGTENTTVNLAYRNKALLQSDVRAQIYYADLTTRFSKFPGYSQAEITSEKFGGRLTIDTPVQAGPISLNAIWGMDYLHDETAQPAFNAPQTTPELKQDALAGFLQLEVPVADFGLLRGGIRYEDISVEADDVVNGQDVAVNGGFLSFSETLFNVSATVFITDNAELFGGFSQGFSLADLGRAINDTKETDVSALQSEVQTVDNYELGLRAQYERWNASVSGFFSESDNGTTFDQDLVIAKQPERIYGVEFTVDVTPLEALRVGGTFSWLEGEVDLDDDGNFDEDLPSTRVPPLKATAYGEYRPFDWWTLYLQGLYSGDRNPDSTQFGNGEVDDYVIFDLFSSFDTGYGKLQLGVQNLLNEDYFPVLNQAGALPFAFSKGPGRTVSLTYSIKW